MRKSNKSFPATAINEEVNKSRESPKSVDTVIKPLRTVCLHGRIACLKPLLRPINKTKCRKLAK